ncbi:MAG: hypothetical protein KBD48_03660 [Candidatus Pacebacteria bacterium]|nr:hypothetical protein [Candidatus Paceibacterota bacterium]MBP9716253.1 hypothetical protein [Candidatus Paceibacterota bacterium]
MKYFNYKIILFLFILVVIPLYEVSAANLYIKPSSNSVGLGEQFYVDIMLDTEGESYNGIEGSFSFSPDTTFFVRYEDGKSMFNTWIQKPVLEGGKISFSGIAPNGFSGVIDPFNPQSKLPGIVLRMIFNGIKPGDLDFSTSKFYITKNDGSGTMEELAPKIYSVKLQNVDNYFVFTNKVDSNPQVEFEVVKDPNLLNNRYALVFKATDKDTGIKSVMVKEGNREWKEINSPYLLEDQNRRSLISIRATSYAGSTIIASIDPLPPSPLSIYIKYSIYLIVLIFALFIAKKYYNMRLKR